MDEHNFFFSLGLLHGLQVPDPGRIKNLRRGGEELCAINKMSQAPPLNRTL
jgi:hypothetical protein